MEMAARRPKQLTRQRTCCAHYRTFLVDQDLQALGGIVYCPDSTSTLELAAQKTKRLETIDAHGGKDVLRILPSRAIVPNGVAFSYN